MPKSNFRLSCILLLLFPSSLVLAYQNAAPDAQAPSQTTNSPAPKQPGQNPNNAPPDLVSIDKKLGPRAAAWALLKWGVSSTKVIDRSDAISGLTVLENDRRAVALIEEGLNDKNDDIRYLAATSLGNMKARPAVLHLRAALDDQSVRVSFAAAQSLWKMNDRSGRYVIYSVLDGERKPTVGLIQGKVKDAKRTMHDPKAMALLGVNEVSGIFLGPFSMGISMAEEYAKNNSAPVQALCAQLLSADDSHLTILELRSALDDKNWAVRAAAAKSVANLGDNDSFPRVKDMMENDKTQSARFVAAASLIRLGDYAGRPSASGHRKNAAATASKDSSNPGTAKQLPDSKKESNK